LVAAAAAGDGFTPAALIHKAFPELAGLDLSKKGMQDLVVAKGIPGLAGSDLTFDKLDAAKAVAQNAGYNIDSLESAAFITANPKLKLALALNTTLASVDPDLIKTLTEDAA
jgi:hypothetical protein